MARGASDVVPGDELLTVGGRGTVRLELDVEASPVGDDVFEPGPIADDLSGELADPDTPPDIPDSDRLDPDKLEDPAVLEARLDEARGADKSEVPLVAIEEAEFGKTDPALVLLMLDDNGLVELRLLPAGLNTPELGLHGCRNRVGSSGGVTGEVGLCTEPGV